jgi:ComF family protein
VCDRCAAQLRAAPHVAPPDGVDEWHAVLAYEGVARELVARAKYRKSHAVFAWLAREMSALVGPPVPHVITWVPTTAARRRERGFDHAELLARRVARCLSRPAQELLRRADAEPQTGRSGADRRVGPTIAPTRAAPGAVLLVDDVSTTGASISSAAVALRQAGARSVIALTAARTPAPAIHR